MGWFRDRREEGGLGRSNRTERQFGPPLLIPRDAIIRGDLHSNGTVRLEGALHGRLEAATVEIGPSGLTDGEIVSGGVVIISGTMQGRIIAAEVVIQSSAVVEGEILADRFSAEPGARLRLGYVGPALGAPEPSNTRIEHHPELIGRLPALQPAPRRA